MEIEHEELKAFFRVLLPLLDERQRRLVAGATAKMLGPGTIGRVAEAAGMSRNTVVGGMNEIARGSLTDGRVRAPGAGRKKLVESEPKLLGALDELIEPLGDANAASPLRWTDRSTAKLADTLAEGGFFVSPDTVGRLLKLMGYYLQPPVTAVATDPGPDIDLRGIVELVVARLDNGEPVVSVQVARAQAASPQAGPDTLATSAPRGATAGANGIYSLAGTENWIGVGDDPIAASLAIRAVRRWWETMGLDRFPRAGHLLIVAHPGTPSATTAWSSDLLRLTRDIGLEVSVCRLPPATVRWRSIEHRLFSFVTNRHQRDRVAYRTIVELCGNAASMGLRELAELDEDRPPYEPA